MSRDVFDLVLTRRRVLQLAATGAVAVAVPTRLFAQAGHAAVGTLQPFLTDTELAIVDAATARIVPTDALPGAHEAGVTGYIQGLLSLPLSGDANCDGQLTAADVAAIARQIGPSTGASCPNADVNGDGRVDDLDRNSVATTVFGPPAVAAGAPVFAGGPFSGRQPFGDFVTGQATDTFPPNNFPQFVRLTRLQRLAWTVRLDGATGVPEVANNPLATSQPDVNLRGQYRAGLMQLDQASQTKYGRRFVQLTPAQQDQVLNRPQLSTFVNLLTRHTFEGLMSDPIYGGNRDRVGWQLVGFDGDSQPLGYTLGFDEPTQQYLERADKPNSLPNPDEDCHGFSETMVSYLTVVATNSLTQPNMVFPNPYCFGVPA